jgi:hypothetical protein
MENIIVHLNPLKTKLPVLYTRTGCVRAVNTLHLSYTNPILMLYMTNVALCSETHTQRINAM